MRISILILAIAALVSVDPATAQDRRFSVTSFDEIVVEGGYAVTLEVGASPYAEADGSPAALDGVDLRVVSRRLVVRSRNNGASSRRRGDVADPVTIRLGTPTLRRARVNGAGSLTIDRVEADDFLLDIQGAGSASVGDLAANRFQLVLNGAASATLSGKVEQADMLVRGASTLTAQDFAMDGLDLGVTGPSTVLLGDTGIATIAAQGTATISVAGDPACTLSLQGSVDLEGCGSVSNQRERR